MTDAEKILFKQCKQGDLYVHVFRPPEQISCAIVFFVCGGWNGFNVEKFFPQSAILTAQGALCAIAEVRTIEVHGTRPQECVIDAKSAIRFVRSQASNWNFPADRIVAAGGSAAGHVSLSCAMIDGFEDPADAQSEISSRPNAVCAYNPAVLPPLGKSASTQERLQSRLDKFGGEEALMALSPTQAVRPGLVPVLLMHGDSDEVTPLSDTQLFHQAMLTAGNDCELQVYADAGHGFFNYNPSDQRYFDETTGHVVDFLQRLQFL